MTFRKAGDETLREVSTHASAMASFEAQQERGYAHLGWLLLEVAEMQYWRVYYQSFGEYLDDVSKAAKKSPNLLRRYMHTVRDLSQSFSSEEMEKIGITKAMHLRVCKDYGPISEAIKHAALDEDVTARELRNIIRAVLKMPDDEGDWLDCEMEFFVSPEQRATIEQAIDVAMRTEPLTKAHIARSAQMLDVMIKLCQEFLGAHSGDGL